MHIYDIDTSLIIHVRTNKCCVVHHLLDVQNARGKHRKFR